MKNIHLLPTPKPSRLSDCHNNKLYLDDVRYLKSYQNIYVTNLEEIKEGHDQWYLDKFLNKPRNSSGSQYAEKQDVIILTTDVDLIKDGVADLFKDNLTFIEYLIKHIDMQWAKVIPLMSNNGRALFGYKVETPEESLIKQI